LGAARILVVDDEKGLCEVLRDLLELEGYEVECCEDRDSAQDALARGSFQVALVDVFLSDKPLGLELGRWIQSNRPEMGLVFITGYADAEDERAGRLDAAYTCIRKPFMLDDIVRVVAMAAEGRKCP